VRRYGNGLWFDPGLPEVRDLISDVVLDVVRKYDIDGVHFDDYFYPYPLPGKGFPDKATFKKYGSGFEHLGDWRRDNVDMLVRGLYGRIHQAKQWVKFGISLFGVWRNKSGDQNGSDTNALQSYDDIYADTRKWVKRGWLDYVSPQLYWPAGFKAADYRTLVAWWASQVSGTPVQLIIGQAAYLVGRGGRWNDPAELSRHLTFDSRYKAVSGDAFFSATDLDQDRKGFATRLLRDHYARTAVVPVNPRSGGTPPVPPERLEAKDGRLSWHGSGAAAYAIYRAPAAKARPCIVPDGRLLLKVVTGDSHEAVDANARSGQVYTYYVTALDRLHRESPATRGVKMTTHGG